MEAVLFTCNQAETGCHVYTFSLGHTRQLLHCTPIESASIDNYTAHRCALYCNTGLVCPADSHKPAHTLPEYCITRGNLLQEVTRILVRYKLTPRS